MEGTVSCRDGTVSCRDGTVSCRDGTVSCREGTVSCRDGTVSCRDGTVSCREQLVQAWTCLTEDSVPAPSSVYVASVLLSCLSGDVPPGDAGDAWELTCLSLSLLDNVSNRLLSPSLSTHAQLGWTETLRLLLEDMDVMSPLVSLFRVEDLVTSHLAAKTASTWVFLQLVQCEKLSPVWQRTCVQAFHSSPPAAHLDTCLWTLTDVLKRLLKGGHQELLRRLLAAFDCSVGALFVRLLPGETEELMRCWEQRWGTTFCLLLDVLEVLTASSLMCGGGTGLTSHTITQTHSSALLTAVSCSSKYFVKKRTLLLLKRAVCQRAGEEWSLDRAPSTRPDSDMRELARCVLKAVDQNWLQSVPVGAAAFFGGARPPREGFFGGARPPREGFFGGARPPREGSGQRADGVMLRAVSLLLLKSIDLHIQTEGAVWRHLQCLWDFLKQRSPVLTDVTHRCSWISLVFADQDDDLMEASRTSLSIFLRLRRRSDLDSLRVSEAACASGCNPHCHFLLLLQSVSFDHSILLDFLMSSETCFLEYLVLYLKFLREDRQGFAAACGGSAVCRPSTQRSVTASTQRSVTASTQRSVTASTQRSVTASTQRSVTASHVPLHVDELDGVTLNSGGRSVPCEPPAGGSRSAAGLRLVAYDSSEDSESESPLDVKREADGTFPSITQNPPSSPASLSDADANPGRGSETLPSISTHQPTATVSRQETCEALDRAVLCLSQLRAVLTRLQTKKLFPYNPSSLIKLLGQVEN